MPIWRVGLIRAGTSALLPVCSLQPEFSQDSPLRLSCVLDETYLVQIVQGGDRIDDWHNQLIVLYFQSESNTAYWHGRVVHVMMQPGDAVVTLRVQSCLLACHADNYNCSWQETSLSQVVQTVLQSHGIRVLGAADQDSLLPPSFNDTGFHILCHALALSGRPVALVHDRQMVYLSMDDNFSVVQKLTFVTGAQLLIDRACVVNLTENEHDHHTRFRHYAWQADVMSYDTTDFGSQGDLSHVYEKSLDHVRTEHLAATCQRSLFSASTNMANLSLGQMIHLEHDPFADEAKKYHIVKIRHRFDHLRGYMNDVILSAMPNFYYFPEKTQTPWHHTATIKKNQISYFGEDRMAANMVKPTSDPDYIFQWPYDDETLVDVVMLHGDSTTPCILGVQTSACDPLFQWSNDVASIVCLDDEIQWSCVSKMQMDCAGLHWLAAEGGVSFSVDHFSATANNKGQMMAQDIAIKSQTMHWTADNWQWSVDRDFKMQVQKNLRMDADVFVIDSMEQIKINSGNNQHWQVTQGDLNIEVSGKCSLHAQDIDMFAAETIYLKAGGSEIALSQDSILIHGAAVVFDGNLTIKSNSPAHLNAQESLVCSFHPQFENL